MQLSLWCCPLPGVGLMHEATGAHTLAQGRLATCVAGITQCCRGEHQAQEVYSSLSCRSHYWNTPCCIPEQCLTTSEEQAQSQLAALCSSVSQRGLRLLCSHWDLLQSPFIFGHLLLPSSTLPRAGGGRRGFGSPAAMGWGQGNECVCEVAPCTEHFSLPRYQHSNQLIFHAKGSDSHTSFLFITSLIKHFPLSAPADISGSK